MDPALGHDELSSGRALRQLQAETVVAHGVAVADDVLLLAAQDVRDLLQAGPAFGGPRGRGGLNGRCRQADKPLG